MNEKLKKGLILSLVLVLCVLAIAGGTFAYFSAAVGDGGNKIKGNTLSFNANVGVDTIRSGNLIPTADNLIMTSLNGSYPCEDSRGYSLCSLYKITLTNSGPGVRLNGYVLTNAGTSFTSSYLKYQLLTKSTSYASASDINTLNISNNSKNYFKLNNNNITFSLNQNGSSEYYLVVWLSDPGNVNQLDDVNKSYNGSIVFESSNGGRISVNFTA